MENDEFLEEIKDEIKHISETIGSNEVELTLSKEELTDNGIDIETLKDIVYDIDDTLVILDVSYVPYYKLLRE